MISLIAFLGNVGREYERTRHNAAWIAADRLSICGGISWQHKFRGLYGRFPAAVSAGQAVHALKPETYMNLSGEAVGEAAQFFKIPPAEILVVHDELELPPAALSSPIVFCSASMFARASICRATFSSVAMFSPIKKPPMSGAA